jgi:hypothetical protein
LEAIANRLKSGVRRESEKERNNKGQRGAAVRPPDRGHEPSRTVMRDPCAGRGLAVRAVLVHPAATAHNRCVNAPARRADSSPAAGARRGSRHERVTLTGQRGPARPFRHRGVRRPGGNTEHTSDRT